jgi:hypothetical protein
MPKPKNQMEPTEQSSSVQEMPSGVRLAIKTPSIHEARYELPCGVEVIKRVGKGSDFLKVIRLSGSNPDKINLLLIHYLVDFIDADGNRTKLSADDIAELPYEDFFALQELVNPEKKLRLIEENTSST